MEDEHNQERKMVEGLETDGAAVGKMVEELEMSSTVVGLWRY